MKNKNLKKIFTIIGLVAIGLYLLGIIVTTSINIISNIHVIGYPILSNLWTMTKSIIIYGFMCAFLIYELAKKSDKHDKVLNIILFVSFCILALSSLISIFKTIGVIVKAIKYLNGLSIITYIISILNNILRIGLFALFGINIMELIMNKNKASKIFTFIIWGLLVLIFSNSLVSTIISLIGKLNVGLILVNLGSLFNGFTLAVFQACLAFVIYKKLNDSNSSTKKSNNSKKSNKKTT